MQGAHVTASFAGTDRCCGEVIGQDNSPYRYDGHDEDLFYAFSWVPVFCASMCNVGSVESRTDARLDPVTLGIREEGVGQVS